jgi:hypothetical protein
LTAIALHGLLAVAIVGSLAAGHCMSGLSFPPTRLKLFKAD